MAQEREQVPLDKGTPRRRPAKTISARDNQLIAMAYDLAEEQFRSGKVSAQVHSHFLKMGTERDRLEREKIKHENDLLRVRAEEIEKDREAAIQYGRVVEALKGYRGLNDD